MTVSQKWPNHAVFTQPPKTALKMTTTMTNIEGLLSSIITDLSEENYESSFAQYRFLFEIARTYSQIPPDLIFDSIWKQIKNRKFHSLNNWGISFPASPLILRFARDAEPDSTLSSHSAGLKSRLFTNVLTEFFDHGLGVLCCGNGRSSDYLLDVNFIAHGVNLGYIEETAIREHILQFLIGGITCPAQYHCRVFALCVLLKIAGATFDAYADSSVVDRCIELLKGYDCGGNAALEQIKVGGLYKRVWSGLREIIGGSNSTAATELGGSTSTTCFCNQGTRANRDGPRGSRRNSHRHISGTAKHGPQTSGSSAPSARICHRPRDRNGSPLHPVAINQHCQFVRLHHLRYFRSRVSPRPHDHNPP